MGWVGGWVFSGCVAAAVLELLRHSIHAWAQFQSCFGDFNFVSVAMFICNADSLAVSFVERCFLSGIFIVKFIRGQLQLCEFLIVQFPPYDVSGFMGSSGLSF